jgi:alpha/beta superfamily hydrolase
MMEHPIEFAARHVSFPGSPVEGEEPPMLEGRLHVLADGTLHPGVVLCHANPAAGGNMDMALMQCIEAALADAGFATLRYNSRGVGNSQGAVSRAEGGRLVAPEGTPEKGDVGAALTFLGLQDGVDASGLCIVGHSFGARIGLAYVSEHQDDERVQAVVCIGLPVAWRDLSYLGDWPRPKLFVTGDRDDFCPPDELSEFVSRLPAPANMVTLKNTGHFYEGREHELASVVEAFLSQVVKRET